MPLIFWQCNQWSRLYPSRFVHHRRIILSIASSSDPAGYLDSKTSHISRTASQLYNKTHIDIGIQTIPINAQITYWSAICLPLWTIWDDPVQDQNTKRTSYQWCRRLSTGQRRPGTLNGLGLVWWRHSEVATEFKSSRVGDKLIARNQIKMSTCSKLWAYILIPWLDCDLKAWNLLIQCTGHKLKSINIIRKYIRSITSSFQPSSWTVRM